jgi:hypothetical protein
VGSHIPNAILATVASATSSLSTAPNAFARTRLDSVRAAHLDDDDAVATVALPLRRRLFRRSSAGLIDDDDT